MHWTPREPASSRSPRSRWPRSPWERSPPSLGVRDTSRPPPVSSGGELRAESRKPRLQLRDGLGVLGLRMGPVASVSLRALTPDCLRVPVGHSQIGWGADDKRMCGGQIPPRPIIACANTCKVPRNTQAFMETGRQNKNGNNKQIQSLAESGGRSFLSGPSAPTRSAGLTLSGVC